MTTSKKLVDSENYSSWSASMKLWFMDQGYEDHLVTQEADIPEVDRVQWRKIDAQLYSQIASLKEEFLIVMPLTTDVGDQRTQIDKFFMVLTHIGLRPNLETVCDQILGNSSVPSLDDVFARLLRISSTQTLSSDNTSDSSELVSQTNSREGRSGNRGRGQRPQYTYCNKLGHTRDRCYQLHGRPPRTTHVAQSSNPQPPQPPSSSTSQGISLTDNSGASDHISNNKDFFSSITTTSALPTVTLSNGSQTVAKGIGPEYREDNWHRTTNFLPKPQNASSWDTPNFKRVIVVIPLRLIATFDPLMSPSLRTHHSSPPLMSSRTLQVYHRRHRVTVPPSLAEVPADSLPIPSASPAPALPPSADLPIALQKGWRQAMVDEMGALHSNGTWDLVDLPSSKSTIGCRWVYTVKVGPNGQVDRLKAQLVAKGYTQVYGSDHGDTFSPIAKITSVRLLLFMAAMRSWPLYQLRRSLYGLKQSPRAWFSRFSSIVQEFGMFRSTADHFVFYHHNSSGQCIYLIVYVDDIVITGSDQNGIEIAQSSSGVILSQRKYALDILEETGMLDCKPVDTPMDPNVKLIPGQREPLGDLGRYRRLVGKLNYLTITHPDISFPKSKKQDVVVGSSAEVMYRAMALETCELIWLKHLLRELRFGNDEQMKLICDNQATLHIASNPVFHERTKHIEVDCHFIREKIAS
ncbi:Retrovirus-related Pol polyprotein from transposon RE1 [Vitis vinifera]|uniref:Retrovirus-related Pol polyprotein from transposon RE1 n=1 Tax=Vitis vinifera TaxID=29760 RepID=A0A438G023_VITVI|nr:Retrovirus-related Pol polyprotein from transposon RE1 [Vitis vinifera]